MTNDQNGRKLLAPQRWTVMLVLCTLGVGICQNAHASSSAPTREGLRLGNLRLQPFFNLDTNFVYNAENSPGESVAGAAPIVNDLSFAPVLGGKLEWQNGSTSLSLGSSLSWRQFLGIGNSQTTNQSGFVGDLDLNLLLNKGSSIPITLTARGERVEDPGFLNSQRLGHWIVTPGLNATIKPGGGALKFTTGYNFRLDSYDSDATISCPGSLDSLGHNALLGASWSFLPKTEVVVDTNISATTYPTQGTSDCSNLNTDTLIMDIRAGLKSALTGKISALLQFGYGDTFGLGNDNSSASTNFRSIVLGGKITYLIGPTSKISLGFDRAPSATPLYQVRTSNRTTLTYNQLIAGRIDLNGTLAVDFSQYGSDDVPLNLANNPTQIPDSRDEVSVAFRLEANYRILDWLSVGLRNNFDLRNSAEYSLTNFVANATTLRVAMQY